MRRSDRQSSRAAKGNALWGGKGTSGTRSNGLWGGGSRGAALLVAALLATALVTISSPVAGADTPQGTTTAYVSADLLSEAQANPQQSFDVIVQGDLSHRTSWVSQNVASDATGVSQQDVSTAQDALQTVQQQASSAVSHWHSLQSQASKAEQNAAGVRTRYGHHQVSASQLQQANQAANQAAQAADGAEQQADQLTSQEPALQTAVGQAQQGASDTQQSLNSEEQFTAIPGLDLTLTGQQIIHLSHRPGILSIVANTPVKMSGSIDGMSNDQLWPWVSGATQVWGDPTAAANSPTIAVLDSGVDPDASQLGNRLLGQVDLSTLDDNSPTGDGYGHGTFVATIAAGSSAGYAGTDPYANIYSVDIMNDEGEANIADVIAGCDWVLANKDQYNIRVVNLSLTGTTPASVMFDPLDQAVEQLWLNGVVVVAAAGNYNTDGTPSGVLFAPGNDPFIITVGATDTNGTVDDSDDFTAPWSAFGSTLDGFAKPDLGAPGRYMISPVPADGGLAAERPDAVIAPGYMELSGTSFAAPVVSGAAAYLLALHPDWTPDQVKGALMVSAEPTPEAYPGSDGVGEVNIPAASQVTDPPDPNAGLNQYLTQDADGTTAFDAAAWNSDATSNAAWNSAAWSSAAWSSAAWSSAAWSSAAWSSAAWASAAWSSAAWSSAAWSSAAWSSAAWSSAAWANSTSVDPPAPQTPMTNSQEAAIAKELGVTLDGATAATSAGSGSGTATGDDTTTTTTSDDSTATASGDSTASDDSTTTAGSDGTDQSASGDSDGSDTTTSSPAPASGGSSGSDAGAASSDDSSSDSGSSSSSSPSSG